MTLRTRRKIFYTLVALFIVLGTGVTLYAQGWRFDISTGHFEKIGGIYVRSYPGDASISLSGKPIQNQSGFLAPGTLISDLLPKTYTLTLKAPGYDTWQENATVNPAIVTQFKYAVLVPKNGTAVSSSIVTTLVGQISSTSTAAGINPYNTNLKLTSKRDVITIFNFAEATTTATTTISGSVASTSWINDNLAAILQNDGELYLYDTDTETIRKLADDVKTFSVSTDGAMIATVETNSLEVFSLVDPTIYSRFNLPDISDVRRAIWYRDDTHLFIVYPSHIAFLDLADNGLANFITIANGTSPIYDASTNSLYIKESLGGYLRYDFIF